MLDQELKLGSEVECRMPHKTETGTVVRLAEGGAIVSFFRYKIIQGGRAVALPPYETFVSYEQMRKTG